MKKICFVLFLCVYKQTFSQLPVTCSLNILNMGSSGSTYSFNAFVTPFSSPGTVYTWSWTNGAQSGGTMNIGSGLAVFNFTAPGVYTVCVNTFSSGCSNNPQGCTTVNVAATQNCSINISVNSVLGNTVNVSASVVPTPSMPFGNYVWTWTGPSSGSITSPIPNAILTLTPSGLYTVCVIAFSTGCSNNPSTCTTINVSSMTNCTANLNVNVSGNNAQATLNISPGNPTSGNFNWNWFGVSNGSTSTTSNTLNLNNLAAGVYDLCVTAFSVSGCSNIMNSCFVFTIGNMICQPTLNIISSSGMNFQFSVNVPGGSVSSYNWIWTGPTNGNTVTNSPSLSLNFTQPGVYQVCAVPNGSNSSCFTFTSSCINVTVTTVGLVQFDKDNALILMPNPVQSRLKLSYDGNSKGIINIIDVNGKKVLSIDEFDEKKSPYIEVNQLQTGIYSLLYFTGSKIHSIRFVKE